MYFSCRYQQVRSIQVLHHDCDREVAFAHTMATISNDELLDKLFNEAINGHEQANAESQPMSQVELF